MLVVLAMLVMLVVAALGSCDRFCQQARTLPHSARRVLFSNDTVDTDELLEELPLADNVRHAVRRSCHSERSPILHRSSVLAPSAVAAVRRALDAHLEQQENIDSEFKLRLERLQLDAIIGAAAARSLWAIPSEYAAQRHGSGTDQFTSGDLQAAVVWVKLYSPETRPFNELHTDSSALTINVALSDDDDCEGGALLACDGGGMRAIRRRAGDATTHGADVLHGVSNVVAGQRYSLLVFIGREAILPSRLRLESSEERRAEALALLELLADAEGLARHCAAVFGPSALAILHERATSTYQPLRAQPTEAAVEQLGMAAESGMQQGASEADDAERLRPSSIRRAKARHELLLASARDGGGDEHARHEGHAWCAALRTLLTAAEANQRPMASTVVRRAVVREQLRFDGEGRLVSSADEG